MIGLIRENRHSLIEIIWREKDGMRDSKVSG